MLGAVADADVELAGTGGALGSGTTDASGNFGPISYSATYSGPLRITVTGNAGSTWTCDFRYGCAAGDVVYAFGQVMPFDGTLEAVLPTAGSGQTVYVSLLSNFVAERMDHLGGLNATNVNSANADILNTIRLVLGDTFDQLSIALSGQLSTIEVFDLNDPPAASAVDESLNVILTLLNSALVGLSDPAQTTAEFIDFFSNQVATQPNLPISRPQFLDASQESMLSAYIVQSLDIYFADDALTAAIDALLAPLALDTLLIAAFDTYDALPAILVGGGDIFQFIDDAAILGPIFREVTVATSTGAPLGLNDFAAEVETLAGGEWLTATPVSIGGQPHLRLDFDNAVILTLPNGSYEAFVDTYSTTGQYVRTSSLVTLQVAINGLQVSAGPDISASERSNIQLQGSTSSPGDVVTINWVQTGGPGVVITGADSFAPTVELPEVVSSQVANLRLDVEFSGGLVRSDFIDITIEAYANIADLTLADAALDQCVSNAATAGGFTDVGEVTELSCVGVNDVSGLELFINLTSLNLAGNGLKSLGPLLALPDLQFLDISGNPLLSCSEIDQLATRLEEGTALIVDDTCRGEVLLDLGASGFDAALDEVRNQIYVSLPDRNEIAVVSLADLRIVDRLALAGRPYGIDLSIDGTRVFAALNGSNSVAVVDLEQRSVTSIDLGTSTGHSTTYDVVEAQPNRLFVSANPSSSGFAYIAQVRLDQGNITSRAANERIIRARPTLARSPDQQFVYVSEGFSPNSLYKLTLATAGAEIVLEDSHGSVSGTENLALNLAGTRIALGSGQVLRTGSFIAEGSVTAGRSVGSSLEDTLFVAAPNGVIESYDFTTLERTATLATSCDGATSRILAYGGDESFMLLQGQTACLHTAVSRTTPVDPYAALRFIDLALEECVIDTAINFGYTQPEEFTALDCSATPKTILSLDGIERLVNLQALDVSNSGVFDLSPLGTMSSLQSLSVANAGLSDIDVLFTMSGLTSANLVGNSGIACTDLDQLVAGAVTVTADTCTSTVRIELGGIGHDMEFDVAGERAFVSIPSLNRISEIDLGAGSIAGNFSLAGQPYGISLSSDLQTIYAALYGAGDIAVLDTTDGSTEVIDISVELDDDRTWDVAEVSTDRVVASTNPGSNGFGYIVEVRRDLGNAATRVADQRIIRAGPILAVSNDQTAVYVGEGFSPNSLYKLDATQATLPLVLEDDHGEVSGTSSLALSPDGSRIYLFSGQVLATDTFNQVAQFAAGRSVVSADGSKLLVADTNTDSARVYNTSTTGQTGNLTWGCDLLTVAAISEYGNGVLALGDDLVCYSRIVPYP